jgi:hypothetical protein
MIDISIATEIVCRPTTALTLHVEVKGELHILVALPTGEETVVPIG